MRLKRVIGAQGSVLLQERVAGRRVEPFGRLGRIRIERQPHRPARQGGAHVTRLLTPRRVLSCPLPGAPFGGSLMVGASFPPRDAGTPGTPSPSGAGVQGLA